MRRSLDDLPPLPDVEAAGRGVVVRAFRPGQDEVAFLAVNAEAFAGHPEQGSLGRADLDQRMAEAWFDPAGFFVAEALPGDGSEAATDPAERTRLQASLGVTEAHAKAVQETVVKAPNVTFSQVMTIHKGGREVQLHFVGRGHTSGDTMVFLPAERIVFTGDFFEGSPTGGVLSYLGDAFID